MTDINNKHFHRQKNTEIEFITASLALILGHFLGLFYNWYNLYPFFDFIVHFIGGTWVALAAFTFVSSLGSLGFKKLILSLILIVFAVGVAWEIFEFAVEHYYLINFQGPPLDTLLDLIADMLGGSAIAFYLRYHRD